MEERTFKKGDICEGLVSHVDFPNKGRIYIDGQLITVKNAIPGQIVRFMINKKKKGRMEGRLLEVIKRSALENTYPVCSNFPFCGGCTYQTMDYDQQLLMKETQVKKLLDIEQDVFEGIIGSPKQYEYRNKMEFSFGDAEKDGPLTLGLHKKGSTYDVLTTSDCKLVHGDMRTILAFVLDYFHDHSFPYYKKMQHTGYLRHLLLRRSEYNGDILVHLVTTSAYEPNLNLFTEGLLNLKLDGQIVGIMHIINDSMADIVQSDETRILFGRDYFFEKISGLIFKVSTFSFFQTNTEGAALLYDTARSFIGDTRDKVVFDLYSGTGTIAQILAPVSKKVIGVEIVKEAVDAAIENAALNGLDNCEFICGDVLKAIDDIEEKPDFIVVDPPRDGIHPKALPKILAYQVPNIVYISCKPTSLARDLEAFYEAGYTVKRIKCVDMFPNTVHVETVVLMSRADG